MNPKVSIITPLFNAEAFIADTLKSVQQQTFTNWEHIIIDDCSTDDSVSIVRRWAEKDSRIRLENLKENKGAAFSRNRATELALGEYIAFLDSDDLWVPEKLQEQISFMEEQDCAVSFSSYLHMDEEGNSLGKRIKALPAVSFEKQHSNNYIGNLTGVYKAAEIGKIMAPGIRKRQDWAVWLEAIKRSGKPALGIQQDLAWYRVRKDSISANKWKLIKFNFQFYRKHLGYSWLSSAFYLLRFFWEYFIIRPKQIESI